MLHVWTLPVLQDDVEVGLVRLQTCIRPVDGLSAQAPMELSAYLVLITSQAFYSHCNTLRLSRYWFDLSAISHHRANRGTVEISSLFNLQPVEIPGDLPAIPPFDRILPGPSTLR